MAARANSPAPAPPSANGADSENSELPLVDALALVDTADPDATVDAEVDDAELCGIAEESASSARDDEADSYRFDWANDDAVVLAEQPALAVYRNKFGTIAIRQEASWDRDEDSFVFVQANNVPAVIHALGRAIRKTVSLK